MLVVAADAIVFGLLLHCNSCLMTAVLQYGEDHAIADARVVVDHQN